MKRSSLGAGAIGLAAVLLIAFVAQKSQSLDFQEHSRYQSALVHLKELDALLNADVLASRFELENSYDPLVATLAELTATQVELATPPTFVNADGRAELMNLLASHAQSAQEKADLVERFKSDNAILRNTLHYLPIVYGDMAGTVPQVAPDGVSDIVRDVLLYNLTGNPETARGITARLDQMADVGLAEGTPGAYRLRMLAGHVHIILASKPVLDGLLQRMVALPTMTRAEALATAYARQYERALGEANTYRLMLIGLALILFCCSVLITARLRRTRVERNAATTRLEHQAYHDALTDLPNRILLHARLEAATHRALQTGAPMALLVMDLDRFKEVNDTLGHHAGDELLCQVAARLEAAVQIGDTVARLGGDEFAVLLPATSQAHALAVAARLVRALAAPFTIEDRGIEIGASIGIALVPDHGADAETLLRRADVALYVAKREQSGLILYTPEQDVHSAERLGLAADLRRAIEHGELVLHYQPQVDVQSGELVGFEALARWPHPERGLVPPEEFIPLAEQTRLIRPLSRWAVRSALAQCAEWQGTALGVPVAVNLSAHDLLDVGLAEFVAESLSASGVPAERLRLEITESSLMVDPTGARETLLSLRALGVRIAIDDFGTGYSSLEYLRNLPVDTLKIDRSFVRDMATDVGARAIVRASIDLAEDLGLRVVAEGVEDAASWEVLAGLGCHQAQGYYFGAPLAVSELSRWAANAENWRAERSPSQHTELALATRVRDRGARLATEEEFIARKHAEAALLESEERLRLAVEAVGMATWDWDLATDTITWSGASATLFGVESNPLGEGSAWFVEHVHPEDRPLFEAALASAVRDAGELNLECRIVRTDGVVRGIACTGRVLRDPSGRSLRLVGTLVDITARQAAEHQREGLAQAEKLRALGQLARGVAHDLNQSLLLIAGYADLARTAVHAGVPDARELEDTLAVVTRAALDGGATVKRLLQFARTTPDGESESVDLAMLLHDVAQLTAPRWRDGAQLEGQFIDLSIVIDGDVTVVGWATGLREALMNLIFNAVDALPTGGTIELNARRVGERVEVRIADSGSGMPPEVQTRVFEPFFSTKGDQGTGLGLSQVFGIVEQHHGKISVTSAVGHGTTFALDFPAQLVTPVPVDLAESVVVLPRRSERLRILAVDDEPAIGSMVVRILRPLRHSVTTAVSGEEALERLASEPFDLVLSDLGLGSGMSGWDLAARVGEQWPEVRFILATGWGASIDPDEARSKGISAVLAKPYHPDELQAAIAAA